MRKLTLDVVRKCAAALMLALAMMASAPAQEQPTEIRAVTTILPPFVMKQGDQLTGFSIDLWDEVAARLNLKTRYELVPSFTDLIERMRDKEADVLVGATFYTSERDREFDFSYPILEAGMQVLVRGAGEGGAPTPLKDVLALLFSKSAAIWLGVALVIILVPAHVIWLLDRGREDSVSPNKGYFPGILDALVWATTALVSQVQLLPNQWLARVFGLLWMFAGVVFISLYTAELTATLTIAQIRGAINGPADLPGKRVASLANSTASDYLREVGARVQEYQTVEEAIQALLSEKVDAAFGGAPGIRYYAAHGGLGRVRVVGPEIDRQDMGFLFQLGSPLRKQVGNALIALREDGTYQRIYEKWLGED